MIHFLTSFVHRFFLGMVKTYRLGTQNTHKIEYDFDALNKCCEKYIECQEIMLDVMEVKLDLFDGP